MAKRSFLSLWSYANVYTDEGRVHGKGDGKELCDLLVVFDRHVIIFSDKHCHFPSNQDIELAWSRWFRRAVVKSVRQVVGAKSWMMRFPHRIYLDRQCQKVFPLQLDDLDSMKVHLVAVTRGAHDPCRAHFGGTSTGSLFIDNSVVGADQHKIPFTVGLVNGTNQYVHVLDELTLTVLMHELDTAPDFIDYLDRKERLLANRSRNVIATGEEQLVAMYLTRINSSGEHDFTDIPSNADGVYVSEGRWESLLQNPQYLAKKKADRISYAWDRLIEHLIASGRADNEEQNIYTIEPGLRVMAAEPRLARRYFAELLLEALAKEVPPGQRFLRLGYLKQASGTAYVFLVLPKPPFVSTYSEYREGRRALLLACCKIARLRLNQATQIVGIASEPSGTGGGSEDVVLLKVQGSAWGPEQEAEARRLQKELDILNEGRAQYFERHTEEYPEHAAPLSGLSPAQRLLELARRRRKAAAQLKPRRMPKR